MIVVRRLCIWLRGQPQYSWVFMGGRFPGKFSNHSGNPHCELFVAFLKLKNWCRSSSVLTKQLTCLNIWNLKSSSFLEILSFRGGIQDLGIYGKAEYYYQVSKNEILIVIRKYCQRTIQIWYFQVLFFFFNILVYRMYNSEFKGVLSQIPCPVLQQTLHSVFQLQHILLSLLAWKMWPRSSYGKNQVEKMDTFGSQWNQEQAVQTNQACLSIQQYPIWILSYQALTLQLRILPNLGLILWTSLKQYQNCLCVVSLENMAIDTWIAQVT